MESCERLWKGANGKITLERGMSSEAPTSPSPPRPKQSLCSTPPKRQYPAVDFSRYPSLRRGLITRSYSRYSPNFLASSVFGLKQLRSDGGASWPGAASATVQAAAITPVGELLASLAGCRSSSSFLSTSVGPDRNRNSAGVSEIGDRQAGVEYGGGMVDPAGVLCGEALEHIFLFLDRRSLGACLAVSRGWNRCAKGNFLWDLICKQMWEGKIYVLPSALDPAIPRLLAFQSSLAEGQRVHIESVDLCRWVWEVHVKEEAGAYWMQHDPYYHGLPLMRRIFHEDGHITAEPMDRIWGGHECSWTLRQPESMDGAPLLQVNHWPLLQVTRTSNWGWKMENVWTVYTSTNIPTVSFRSRQLQGELISNGVALVPDT